MSHRQLFYIEKYIKAERLLRIIAVILTKRPIDVYKRQIEIIDDNFNLTRRELVNVPIVGTVTAGEPILAIENIQGYFPIMPEFVNNKQTFMLKVKGEKMCIRDRPFPRSLRW